WANDNSSQPKSRTRSETDNPFDLGDEMEYVGFTTINGETVESQHVTQAQNASETIILTFAVSQGNTDGIPCPGTPTVTDIDGNVYNTVMIGTQCWMKENLRTIANIPSGDTHTLDDNHTSAVDYAGPWRYTPNNDPANVAAYGYLYNWNAVMNGAEPSTANPSGVQGICPYGWHVPSGNEWIQLADYVGNQNEYSCNGIVPSIFIAKALADSVGWDSSTNFCAVGNDLSSNNATGFSARPAGVFGNDAVNSAVTFNNFGQIFGLWTSSEFNSVFANWVIIKNTNSTVTDWNWGTLTKKIGMSVRCVRD
ncbi:MAG: fibrobacter succinogenes major paralogous domain-containing protein, partial [Bacteroidales bacterium]|nr:fibrobacter succinogenes major paralogous domain-containing protein [Bacteroidales bacterium]